MRGKGVVHVFVPEKLGITPAYAGKSFMWTKFCRETRDHPRVCGEKGKNHPRKPYCEGLPPRVRGKDGVNDSAQAVTGITPACAGKRAGAGLSPCKYQDHPRVCGEKPFVTGRSTVLMGSPPRMRGKGCCTHLVIFVDGITPAYAGKRRARRGAGSW